MKYIICADGQGKRWKGETPKHLVKIKGEVLLERTVKMFSVNPDGDSNEIIITSHNPLYNYAKRYEPKNNKYEIDRFLSCRPIWDTQTTFLYGDVYYSHESAIKIMSTLVDGVAFFGRRHGNSVKRYGEIFAVSISNRRRFEEACLVVKDKERRGLARGLAWDVWRRLGRRNFIEVSGCEDFDSVEDLEKFKRNVLR